MTVPNRIELAARALVMLGAERRKAGLPMPTRLEEAEAALKAAFPDAPGLFDDPPRVWLAPMHVTEAMANAMECAWGTEERWQAAQDAHLATQSDPEKGEA